MIKLIPYRPGHFDFLQLKQIYDGDPQIQERFDAIAIAPDGRACTVVHDGRPVAILGAVFRHGTMDIMAGVGEGVTKLPLSFHKICLKLLDAYRGLMEIHRIQFLVLEDYSVGQKWAELLGFQKECLMRKSGPDGRNHFMYAKVF